MSAAEQIDVGIVGGGLSGLVAARKLFASGLAAGSVVVFEQQETLGGRIRRETVDVDLASGESVRVPLEVGCPSFHARQDKLVALARELHLDLVETSEDQGRIVVDVGERVRECSAKAFHAGLDRAEALDLRRAAADIEALCEVVEQGAPQLSPKAEYLDSISAAEWMRQRLRTEYVKTLVEAAVQAAFATTSATISMLHFVTLIQAHGGLEELLHYGRTHPEQQIAGGMSEIIRGLAAEVAEVGGDKAIRFGHSVTRIELLKSEGSASQDVTHISLAEGLARKAGVSGRGVAIFGKDGRGQAFQVVAKYVIIAASPTRVERQMTFTPAVSANRQELMRRCFTGFVHVAIVLYETAFWAERGLSGGVLSDCAHGPVSSVRSQVCETGEQKLHALVCYMNAEHGRASSMLDSSRRRRLVLEQLQKWFGEKALDAVGYVDMSRDSYGGAGYVGLFPTGVLAEHGHARSRPNMHGRLHWAGTEASDVSQGLLDGAIHAAEAAARRVALVLEGSSIAHSAPRGWKKKDWKLERPNEGTGTEKTRLRIVGLAGVLIGLLLSLYAASILYVEVTKAMRFKSMNIGDEEFLVASQQCGSGDVYAEIAQREAL